MTYDDVIMNRLKQDGIYECVVEMFKAKQAEIERLREVLQRIESICAEDGIPHAIRSFRAMREARGALGKEE